MTTLDRRLGRNDAITAVGEARRFVEIAESDVVEG
jgi:hypothetical protein